MVFAQITWWLQPSQRDGSPRTAHLTERDGRTWMHTTDAEIATDIGMSVDQVRRARTSLVKRGLIESKSAKIASRKQTLIAVVAGSGEIAESTSETAESPDQPFGEIAGSRARATPPVEPRQEKTEDPAADAAVLSLPLDVNRERPKATDDPMTRAAHGLAVLAFEQRPKPVTRGGFPAVMARIKEALAAGYPVNAIRAAILAGPVTWTSDGLSTAIAKARRSGPAVDDRVAENRMMIERARGLR